MGGSCWRVATYDGRQRGHRSERGRIVLREAQREECLTCQLEEVHVERRCVLAQLAVHLHAGGGHSRLVGHRIHRNASGGVCSRRQSDLNGVERKREAEAVDGRRVRCEAVEP